MSYCRWSSDDWRCDLYCYENYRGFWATHVAANRIVGDVPRIPWPITDENKDEWLSKYREQMDFVENASRENIGLPHDGESFSDPTLEAFLERLLHLREVGYRFPDSMLETVRAEIKDKEQEEQDPPGQ